VVSYTYGVFAMVTLTIDNETYEALRQKASTHGLSVEQWLKVQNVPGKSGQRSEPPIGEQMAKLFSEIGLADDEVIPELKGQTVRSLEFE
jgi:hypothetical protein